MRGLLESAGIQAVVVNDELATGVGEIASALLPAVSVDGADTKRALAIVKGWLAGKPAVAHGTERP